MNPKQSFGGKSLKDYRAFGSEPLWDKTTAMEMREEPVQPFGRPDFAKSSSQAWHRKEQNQLSQIQVKERNK